MENTSNHTGPQSSVTNIYLLFVALIISILNNYITVLLKYACIFKNKFSPSSQYHGLRKHLLDLQNKSAEIDMTNEFANYARLQRKIIKIQEELKKEVSVRKEVDMKYKMILQIILSVVVVVMMYTNYSQPVIHLNPDWVYPVASMLCWPCGQLGTISFIMWCAISNSVLRTFS